MNSRLLVIDDNEVDRERIARLLGAEHVIEEARTAAEALGLSKSLSFDCVLLDYRLPDVDGIHLLERFVGDGLPVVMLTGQGDEQTAVEAMKRGALDYLAKGGLEGPALRRAVANALEKRTLRRQIETQQEELRTRIAELDRQREQLRSSSRALSERQAKLEALLRQIPAVVWSTDTELVVTSIAGSMRAVGIEASDVLVADVGARLGAAGMLRDAHLRALDAEAAPFEIEHEERVFQGCAEPYRSDDGRIVGVVGAALDVTENRGLERQLRHAQKMEALGQLAGGVAHDFNNLLSAILAFAGFLREPLSAGDQALEDIEEIERAANRGTQLVKQLLAFSRQRPVEAVPLDVGEAVSELLPMLRSLIGEDIQVTLERDDQPWDTYMDPVGLEQLVVNFAVNARDAMPEGGRLTIETRMSRLEESSHSAVRSELSPGDYVSLSVTDEGIGIPPEIVARIFDPFFSTKGPGRGTGLGLATCYGIAQQAGGTIAVSSEPGRGTRFDVYLPRAEEKYEAPQDETASPSVIGGSEGVIVVEDDYQVRSVGIRTLRRLGYRVYEAASPEAALELARSHRDDVALVITDIVMPGMRGPELVRALRQELPRARYLYATGYAGGAIQEILEDGVPTLQKPFTQEILGRKVREVIDG